MHNYNIHSQQPSINVSNVKCIGYYNRTKEFSITSIEANELPLLKNFSDLKAIKDKPLEPKEDDYNDDYAGENRMQSLSNWLEKQKTWPSFQFMTTRQILKCVAANDKQLTIEAVMTKGKIYVYWNGDKGAKLEGDALDVFALSKCFSRLIYETSEDQLTPTYKGVFMTYFRGGCNVLYSAEIDGRNENNEHVEVKLIKGWDWKLKILPTFLAEMAWQCILSNTQYLVVGHREEHSMDSVSIWTLSNLIEKSGNKKLIEEGEERIEVLLATLRNYLKFDGQKVVLKRVNKQWYRVQADSRKSG